MLAALGLYLFVILRSLEAARLAKDRIGAYLVGGIISGFAFQVIYNVTMSAGLAPVKGLTLPLMSYGGSSHDCDARGLRPHPQRPDETVHQLGSLHENTGRGSRASQRALTRGLQNFCQVSPMLDHLWLALTVWLAAALAAVALDVHVRRGPCGGTSPEFP